MPSYRPHATSVGHEIRGQPVVGVEPAPGRELESFPPQHVGGLRVGALGRRHLDEHPVPLVLREPFRSEAGVEDAGSDHGAGFGGLGGERVERIRLAAGAAR